MAETVLVDKKSDVSGYPQFGSPLEVGEALFKAGFDVAACANNHALDKGTYGIDTTIDFYESHGMTCVGIQKSTDETYRPYELISKNGITFALFDYTYGVNMGDPSDKYPDLIHILPSDEAGEKELLKDLEECRKEADFVVVFVHWGQEYDENITDEQKHFAALFAKGGADVVVGSHPHVVQMTQDIERPDGRKTVVYYSLGNFRADQGKDKTSIGLKAYFRAEYRYDGVCLADYGQEEIDAYWKR